jgi:hypothetical protein
MQNYKRNKRRKKNEDDGRNGIERRVVVGTVRKVERDARVVEEAGVDRIQGLVVVIVLNKSERTCIL